MKKYFGTINGNGDALAKKIGGRMTEKQRIRAIELHNGDELFCSVDALDTRPCVGGYVKLDKGFEIVMRPTTKGYYAIVTKIVKSNPEKRWWQFWVKREILGYVLRIVGNEED